MATVRVVRVGAATGSPVRTRVQRAGVATLGALRARVVRAGVSVDANVVANAGTPVTVDSREVVVLSALASGGNPVAYHWTQTAGPAVVLRPSADVPRPEFTAPATDAGTTITHTLTVTNANGTTSTNPAVATVTVRPHIEWAYLGGAWKPVTTDVQLSVPTSTVNRSAADLAVLVDDPVAFFPLAAGDTASGNGTPQVAVAHGAVGATLMPNGDVAAVFDGLSSYFEVADNPTLSVATTGQFTLEMWVRPDTLDSPVAENTAVDPYVHFAGKGVTGQHEYAARFYNAHKDDGSASAAANRFAGFVFNLAGGAAPTSSWQGGVQSTDDGTPPALVAGSWVHYALVVDTVNIDGNGDGTQYLYRNGVLMDHDTMVGVAPANGSAPLRIGTRDLNSFFQGAIGKVAVYSKPLTADRLLAHYTAMVGG